ncbi:hypothetical protein [Bacillus sinesaloumensis]|uniref:hypothetical protein n=1 Tax=Litchfieldia sinesaloumensis TaxID=1926280 RepID=UPI0009883055|nr:hypothetical protein [Bacillus sinesaloumensis]
MWKRLLTGKSEAGTKIRPVNKKKQSDSVFIWESYSEGFNRKRILLELVVPGLIALLSWLITFLSFTSVTEILTKVKETNSEFFTIIAIQIGFNITSLALIGAFNKDKLRSMFAKVKDINKKEKVLKQLLASFIYCVFIQTGIIVVGFFYNINIEDLYKLEYLQKLSTILKNTIVFSLYPIWIWIIFHSFMVSIRNVVLVYKFILVSFKN